MSAASTTVWRVVAWNPVRFVWTVRSTHRVAGDAHEHAEALRWRQPRLRVKVIEATVRVLPGPKPPINNPTRKWRLAQAERMSELADAKKRYKSPG